MKHFKAAGPPCWAHLSDRGGRSVKVRHVLPGQTPDKRRTTRTDLMAAPRAAGQAAGNGLHFQFHRITTGLCPFLRPPHRRSPSPFPLLLLVSLPCSSLPQPCPPLRFPPLPCPARSAPVHTARPGPGPRCRPCARLVMVRLAAPRHATPRHATPRHVTPRQKEAIRSEP